MKDNELITRRNIELALLNKGQHSRRYKLGDIWELNYDEIREVLDDVDTDVQPVQWIPVMERLPEKSGQYYVSGGGKVWICEFRIILNFTGVTGGWCNNAVNPAVQAWMPLP